MTLLLVNQGSGIALQNILNKAAAQNLKLCLFQNDKVPAKGDTEADYTESTFTGYAEATILAAAWTVTPGDPSVAVAAQQVFTSSADQTPENAYGYYLIQSTSGKLVWAERFADGPYAVSVNGQRIWVTPRITLGD